MKLKDFKIIGMFGWVNIYDKNGEEVCMLSNNYGYGDDIPNFILVIGDGRTELEKWNVYKECEVLEIDNAELDPNCESDHVDIKLNI